MVWAANTADRGTLSSFSLSHSFPKQMSGLGVKSCLLCREHDRSSGFFKATTCSPVRGGLIRAARLMGRVLCMGISGKCKGKQHSNLPIPCTRKLPRFTAHSIRHEPAHCVFLSQSKEMEDRKPVTPLEQAGMQSFSFPLSLFHLSSFICYLLKACVSKSSCCCLRALHRALQQDFWFLIDAHIWPI